MIATQSRDNTGMTHDQLRRACPSAFAERAHEKMSSRYLYLPSVEIVDGLAKEGFCPVMAGESRTYDESKKGFTKHVIRLRHADDLGVREVGKDVREVVLVNDFAGGTSYWIRVGAFRLVCTNGMVSGNILHSFKVRHVGGVDVKEEVINATHRLVGSSADLIEQLESWKGIELSREEQLLLAEFALAARYGTPLPGGDFIEGEVTELPVEEEVPYTPQLLLTPRRSEDRKTDLYHTFQKLQENVVEKGGLHAYDSKGKRHTTRAIKGIDQGIKLNTMLEALARKMAELKTS